MKFSHQEKEGSGRDEGGDEPNSDPGDGAEHKAHEDEGGEESMEKIAEEGVPLFLGAPLEEGNEDATAHRELREEDVSDGHCCDEQPRQECVRREDGKVGKIHAHLSGAFPEGTA